MRLATASDLIPWTLDPVADNNPILVSRRGIPMEFFPLGSQMPSRHWLVVGSTGSGKSFFVGCILSRIIMEKSVSVVFIDHNRSFEKIVKEMGIEFAVPESLDELHTDIERHEKYWSTRGSFSGIELSDLTISEKKLGIKLLLERFESHLRQRKNRFPIYLVLDECWNFMRDEPVMVQRAFREYRKFQAGVIAITQSLGDFVSDESGQSILQNSPTRIILRQSEDMGRYQGILGLNDKELRMVRRLELRPGEFSECIVQTPGHSLLARLVPTEEEFRLLRTENLGPSSLRRVEVSAC